MRRILCALMIALTLTAVCAPCRAETAPFADLTLDELYALRAQLEEEIARRQPEGGAAYPPGIYLVGRDIPEGDYVLTEHSEALFAEVIVRGAEDRSAPMLVYSLINGQAAIHLKAETWVTLSGASAVPLERTGAPAPLPEDGTVQEGGYLVGVHLPQGTYRVSPMERITVASFSVYDGLPGSDAALVQYELLREDAEVTLRDGDYVELFGCVMTINEEH